MEDVNMSQSAEQTAIGNVPPGGQAGVKRRVSADAFRALTMRLAGQQPNEPCPAPAPVVNIEAVVETPSVQVPVVERLLAETPVLAVPPIQTIVEPTVEPIVSMQVPVDHALPDPVVETLLVQPAPLGASEQIPKISVTDTDFSETEQPADISLVAELPEQIVEPTIEQPTPQSATTNSLPPIITTQIILTPAPKIKPVEQEIALVKPDTEHLATLQEAIQVEPVAPAHPEVGTVSVSLRAVDKQVDSLPELTVEKPVTVDPLQAAMNLMNAVSAPDENAGQAGLQEIQPDINVAPAISKSDHEVDLKPETVVESVPLERAARNVEGPSVEDLVGNVGEKSPEILQPVENAKEQVPLRQQEPKQSQRKKISIPVIGDAIENPVELEPDAESGETARELLDIMSSGSQPQERALAADTLLRLIPRMMVKDLVALAERVCMMEDAPPLLVKALISHREPRVASPLLEDGKVINEQDLLRLIVTTEVNRLTMMAKHRTISQTVCDALIARGEPSVYLTLIRNPGAALSHDAFVAFNEIAKSQSSLQAPLATRGDTPPPIAFELFWSLPVELRRYVLSRFLTDSATLDKILKITQSVDGGSVANQKFPPIRKVEVLVDLIADGRTGQAAKMMAELAGSNEDNARRIIADPDGEPLTVVFKTMGLTRAQFSQAIKKCATSSKSMLRSDRDLSELQVMFDLLSFNKARTLLTYWDWAIEKTGPYSRRVM